MSLQSAQDLATGLRFASDLESPPWDRTSAEIEVWRDNRGSECAFGQVSGGYPWMRVVGIGDFRIGPACSATVVPDEGVPPADVTDTYYRTVLPMALQLAGREVLHASAVVVPQGVLALCAVSETGKSTLAYGLARRGHELYADDAVVFDAAGPHPTLTQVPFALRLRQASADHFGELSRDFVRVECPQPGTLGQEQGLAAICVLERQGDEQPVACEKSCENSTGVSPERVATVERLSPAAAFAAILPHAYCFSLRDAGRKKRMMQHYLSLARLIPVLRLRFVPGLGHISEILETLEGAIYEHCPPSGGLRPDHQMREKVTVR